MATEPKIKHLYSIPVTDEFFGLHHLQPNTQTLLNRIPVHHFQLETNGLIKLEFVFKAGSCYQDKPLVANLTNSLLREGTKDYSSAEIADTFDHFGASLLLSCDRDRATVGVICMKKHLHQLIPVLASLIKFPSFPDNELKLMCSRQKQEFITNMEKIGYLASRSFNIAIFGKAHPYGKMADSEDFENLYSLDLSAFHSTQYSSDCCEIFITSPKDDALYQLLEKSFGNESWGEQKTLNPAWPQMARPENLDIYFEKKDSLQSAVRIGTGTIHPNHPDFNTFKITNSILGGYFGSRLMKNIREDKGYTYGISSNIISFDKNAYLVVGSEVNAIYSKQVILEILKEITVLQETLVSEEELVTVKNFMIGNFMQSMDGPFNFAEKYKELHYWKLEQNHFLKYLEQIQKVNPDDILKSAQMYFPVNQMIKLIVGNIELKN